MILLQEYTPEIYYKQSRDFQLFGRLFDIVLNSVKTNADMIYDVPSSDAVGSKMIDLLALTLGFKGTHSYNIKQLTAICSILPTILKCKGSYKAIEIVCQTVLTAEGITSDPVIIIDDETHKLSLFIPQTLSDINLLKDLLAYIMPAGITVELARLTSDSFKTHTTIGLMNNKQSVQVYVDKKYIITDEGKKAVFHQTSDYGNLNLNIYEKKDAEGRPIDPKARISYIPTLADMANILTDIDMHKHKAHDQLESTNDRDYTGMITNTGVESLDDGDDRGSSQPDIITNNINDGE